MGTVEPAIQIDGNQWFLLVGVDAQQGLPAFGRTISDAARNMEREYEVHVTIPTEFQGFTEVTPEDYKMSVAQSGG